MGAVAAHAIADAHLAAIAEKASLYQLIHSVVLLWLAGRQGKGFALTRWAFLVGMFLFCGSLYLKALTGWSYATTLAPLGGINFMVGWLMIAVASCKNE
jgi:uncharacterized membrane protein YgdD (TMEM256/DUF423 family)